MTIFRHRFLVKEAYKLLNNFFKQPVSCGCLILAAFDCYFKNRRQRVCMLGFAQTSQRLSIYGI
jgi:hypothetical protein